MEPVDDGWNKRARSLVWAKRVARDLKLEVKTAEDLIALAALLLKYLDEGRFCLSGGWEQEEAFRGLGYRRCAGDGAYLDEPVGLPACDT